jgi:hypothetical protein
MESNAQWLNSQVGNNCATSRGRVKFEKKKKKKKKIKKLNKENVEFN